MTPPQFKPMVMAMVRILVFLAAAYFLLQVGMSQWQAIQSLPASHLMAWLLTAVASGLIYLLLMMLLALAWVAWLGFTEPAPLAQVYLQSQALKYLPGNVFHFAFRHQQSHALGMAHKPLIKASIQETVGLVVMAMLLSQPLLLPMVDLAWLHQHLPMIMVAELVLLTALLVATRQFTWCLAVMVYLLYFMGMGWLTWLLAQALGLSSLDGALLVAVYAASWAAGYLIPGAPGGMGVREAVFVLLLATHLNQGHALVLIASVRLIAVITEGLIYLLARPLSRPYQSLSVLTDRTRS